MRLSRNRWLLQPTHTFLDRSRKDLSKNIWVVALIVYRFRDKRKKRNGTKQRQFCSSGDVAIVFGIGCSSACSLYCRAISKDLICKLKKKVYPPIFHLFFVLCVAKMQKMMLLQMSAFCIFGTYRTK